MQIAAGAVSLKWLRAAYPLHRTVCARTVGARAAWGQLTGPVCIWLGLRTRSIVDSSIGRLIHCLAVGVARTALEWGLAAGLSVSGLYGPLKPWRERQLANIFASGQTLRLQFPKEDLGFVYDQPGSAICTSGAQQVLKDGARHPGPTAFVDKSDKSGQSSTGLTKKLGKDARGYEPSCRPGGRLPHCRLQQLDAGGSQALTYIAIYV